MNIGINATYLEGKRTGVGRYLLNLLINWAKTSPENRYYLYFKNEIPSDEFLNEPCFIKKILKAPKVLDKWIFWENIFLLWQILKEKELDIFFSPGYTLPLYTGKLRTVVSVFDIFYTAHPEWVPLRNRYTLGPLSNFSSCKCDIILTASLFDKQEIVRHYRVSPDKVKVIYLAPEEKFKSESNPDIAKEVLARYDIKRKYILCVGHVINRRLQDHLVRAFAKIHDEFKNITLVIVGQNKSYPYINLKKEICSLHLEESVKWISYLPEDDLPIFYSQAAAFVYVSLYEGESIPLKEAMAAGIPVITSPLLKEVVGDAGYIVRDPRNLDQLKAAMKAVVFDDALRHKLIEKGKKRANMFSWEKCAEETMGALEGVYDSKKT